MYTSTGFIRILNTTKSVALREAAQALITTSKDFLPHCAETTEFPGPSDDAWRFYILTEQGVFTTEAPQDSVLRPGSLLFPLFLKANDVVTAIREYPQSAEAS
jgi:hypothetical protein